MLLTTLLSAAAIAVGAPAFDNGIIIDRFTDPFETESFFENGPESGIFQRAALEAGGELPLAMDMATGDPLTGLTSRVKERQRQLNLAGVFGGGRVSVLKNKGLSTTPVLAQSGDGSLVFTAGAGARGRVSLKYGRRAERHQLNADLTDLGVDGFFGVNLVSDDFGALTGNTDRAFKLRLDVISGLGDDEKQVGTVSQFVSESGDYRFDFASFEDVDFSNVDRIRLTLNQRAIGTDDIRVALSEFGAFGASSGSFERGFVEAVPAPGAFALACVALFAASGRRRSDAESSIR